MHQLIEQIPAYQKNVTSDLKKHCEGFKGVVYLAN